MNTFRRILMGTALVAGLSPAGFGMGHEVVNTDNFNLNIGGRIQEEAYGEVVHDPVSKKDNARAYLFLKQARFAVNGHADDVQYNMQWVGAAEDINGSNNGLTLLDASFDVPLFQLNSTWLKVGQFKVPYSRESLNEEAAFQFTDPSINFIGFNLGRDVGAAIHTYRGKFAGTAGVFTGGSRDVPLRFLPEHLGVPMVVARFGYNDGLDKDIYTVAQNDLHPQRTTKATYVSAMFMKDTAIGHSTVLNVRTSEKSLLMDSNWNPFVARTAGGPEGFSRGKFWQLGWDAAARGAIGSDLAWNMEAEANYAEYSNDFGKVHLSGARAQAGIIKNKIEFALRYSILLPDNNFAFSGVPITGTRPIQEVVPGLTYYRRGHDDKIVLDFPTMIDVPVFVENGVGSYVSTEQIDQSTVIVPSKGHVEKQTVPEARLMYQLAF